MSQRSSDLHTLLNFSIYIFPPNLYSNRFLSIFQILFSIDPNVKGAVSEMFDKSQMSESIDVPAGCLRPCMSLRIILVWLKGSTG